MVLVIKAPSANIQSVRSRLPIWLRQELHDHPAAPVIRMILTFYDQSESPRALEMFIHVDDEQQRADAAALADQEDPLMFFYDEVLRPQFTKVMLYHSQEALTQILFTTEQIHDAIPREQFDFDAAKTAVMEATRL
jgi:hypothetical protein